MGSGFRKKKGKNEFEYYKPSKEDWEAYTQFQSLMAPLV